MSNEELDVRDLAILRELSYAPDGLWGATLVACAQCTGEDLQRLEQAGFILRERDTSAPHGGWAKPDVLWLSQKGWQALSQRPLN